MMAFDLSDLPAVKWAFRSDVICSTRTVTDSVYHEPNSPI